MRKYISTSNKWFSVERRGQMPNRAFTFCTAEEIASERNFLHTLERQCRSTAQQKLMKICCRAVIDSMFIEKGKCLLKIMGLRWVA